MYLTFVKKALFYYTLFKERKGSGRNGEGTNQNVRHCAGAGTQYGNRVKCDSW